DDLGTMSANFVWGALGFYPVTPGSADLMFNSPLFTQEIIHLPSGATMTVNAPQAGGGNFFVQSLNVNGASSTRNWIPASTWQNGVTLDFTLGSTASSWGSAPGDAPPAYNGGGAVPNNRALRHPATADHSCNHTASVTTHTLTPVNARFVRLSIQTPTGNGNGAARIYEVQVFGT